MYLAEIHGKIPSRFKRMEDLLTSNIFSFFKYTDRQIFLKRYLELLDIRIAQNEADKAEFRFWPRFDDETEPDLVLVVGPHYLLFEAKYFSDFGVETKTRKAQLIREIEGGMKEARNEDKHFQIIAITADHYYKTDRFTSIPSKYHHLFKWTNWQLVTAFIHDILDKNSEISVTDHAFASDLYSLLVKKNLRDYLGTQIFLDLNPGLTPIESVFFDYKTASFRGDFIGFINSLQFESKIRPEIMNIIEKNQKGIFTVFDNPPGIIKWHGKVFFEGKT